MGEILFLAFVFLCAGVIAVPIASRLGLGDHGSSNGSGAAMDHRIGHRFNIGSVFNRDRASDTE